MLAWIHHFGDLLKKSKRLDMNTTEKKAAFEKAAIEVIEETIREYRVILESVMVDASAEGQQQPQTTNGAVQ